MTSICYQHQAQVQMIASDVAPKHSSSNADYVSETKEKISPLQQSSYSADTHRMPLVHIPVEMGVNVRPQGIAGLEGYTVKSGKRVLRAP